MRPLRYLVITINAVAAIALLAIGVGAWLIGSERGTAWLVDTVARRAGLELTIGATSGTLGGELTLRDVSLTLDDASRAEIEAVTVSLDLGQLLARAVVIESLRVEPARVTYVPRTPSAPQPPEPLNLPVDIVVLDATFARVEATVGARTHIVEQTGFAGSLIDTRLTLERLDTNVDGIALGAAGRIDLEAEPELALDIDWSGELGAERWAGIGRLGGTWPVLAIEHTLRTPVVVTASGSIDLTTAPRVDLEADWTDLAWPGIEVTSPSGRLALAGGLEALRYRASGQLLARGVPVDFTAAGTASSSVIELEPLELATASSMLSATGRFVVAERSFSLSAEGRDLDTSLLAAEWPGRIDAAGQVRGVLEPVLDVEFDGLTLEGRIRELPFTAALDGRYRAPRAFTFERAEIVSGGDRVTFAGTVGESIDLQLQGHAEQLDLLWPELEGVVDVQLSVGGTLAAPRAEGALEVAELAYGRNALEAARLSGSAELYSGGVLDVTLEGSALALGSVDIDVVGGRASGTMSAHEITLSLDGSEWRTALEGRGALDGRLWTGRLEQLAVEQTDVGLWQLSSPSPVRLAPGRVQVEEACIGRLDAELCAALQWTGARDDRLDLRARGLDLQMLAPLFPEGFGLDGVYALDARFSDLSGDPTGTLSIDGGVTRVQFTASERDQVETQIDEVHLTASLEARRLALDLALEGRDTGRVNLAATVDDVRNELSPIEGRLEVNWSDLAVLSLLSPDVGAVSGAVQVVLDVSGTVETPAVQGRAAWNDGAVEVPVWGVSVNRIEANATSADGSALEFDASGWVEDAELRLTGRSELDRSEGWPTELRLTGDSVPVVQLPEAEVYVSPELDVNVTLPRVRVEGTVLVPRARLSLDQLPEQAVRPSGDAIVHGTEQPEPVRPLDVSADINLVLGDDVTYTGSNLDTILSGDLRLLYNSGQTANASGILSIDGSYDAYGQSLELDRGELIFTGPLDDPTLDVRAVRTIGETTVGVQLNGSLQAPQTRMFSDPAMSEADALAYLLLGRPLAGSGDQESTIVQSAALSMGLQQALPVVQRIGETLGFDEFSIEANDVDTGALMAGKYLSPKVYIRYSYGLFNRIGGLLLRFKINERLSLETRSGDEKSMDLLYTVEKD